MRRMFIEIEKIDKGYSATLSDDSIDRDGEFFASELMDTWAGSITSLPMLANHDNTMQSWIGGWSNPNVEEGDEHRALKMTPTFFSKVANPLAQQIKAQIDEASEMGMRTGVSIGFVPITGQDTSKGYMHTSAELVEGSMVPVQSNRNAGISFAKALRLNGSFKRTSYNGKVGDDVDKKDANQKATPEEMMASMQATIADLDSRIASLEQAASASQADPTAEVDEPAKQLAALQVKQTEWEAKEKKISDELTNERTKRTELEAKVLNQPKGKIPMGTMVAKDKEDKKEDFNATKAYLKSQGIEAE